jgi:hypothetical protein
MLLRLLLLFTFLKADSHEDFIDMTEENDLSAGLMIFLIIYLAIANYIIYKFLMSRIVEEAVSMVVDTSNDDILKPFTYFCFNLVTFVCPVVLSYIKNVML